MAEKKTEKKEKINVEKQEPVFTKAQILASKKYVDRRDALGVVLADEGTYTLNEVDSLLEKFMKGKVK